VAGKGRILTSGINLIIKGRLYMGKILSSCLRFKLVIKSVFSMTPLYQKTQG